jgi:RimJ/RimL family protein N-acetyltransferase
VLRYGDAGLLVFTQMNAVTYEIHFYLLPEHRGKFFRKFVREGIAWMFDNTPCRKVVGMTIQNFDAICGDAGMVREGCFARAFLKDGRLYDMNLYGVCKE